MAGPVQVRPGNSPSEAFIAHFDGSRWQEVPTPQVKGLSELNSVAGMPGGPLFAVDRHGPIDTPARTLILEH